MYIKMVMNFHIILHEDNYILVSFCNLLFFESLQHRRALIHRFSGHFYNQNREIIENKIVTANGKMVVQRR